MRIALFTEHFQPEAKGASETLVHLLDHLERRGHQSLLFAPEGSPTSYGRTRVLPPLESMRAKLSDFAPDLIHVLGPRAVGLDGLRLAETLRIPAIASYHSDLPVHENLWGESLTDTLLWNYVREVHNLADLSLAPSRATKFQMLEMDYRHVETWTQGVDPDLYAPQRRSLATRHRLSNGQADKALVLFAGRLSPENHVEQLKPIMDKLPKARLVIVGDGPQLNWLHNYFQDTATTFMGNLENGELAEAYASCDVFLQPAPSHGFSSAALEAMASGLPVVAPHCGALLDFAEHDRNALLFHAGDSDQAAAHIRAILRKTRLAARLSYQARATAEAWSWQIRLDALLARYQSVLDAQWPGYLVPAPIGRLTLSPHPS